MKTIVVKCDVEPVVAEELDQLAHDSARWQNAILRKLYADKRNGGWKLYGPDHDWGQKYGPVVRRKSARFDVRGEALYPAFIGKGACDLPTYLAATARQLLSMRVATVWSNFLNKDLPRPNGCLPRFRPVGVFHVEPRAISSADGALVLSISLPDGTRRTISTSRSRDAGHAKRLALITAKTGWSAVEVKRHDDGEWYIHVPVTTEAKKPPKQPTVIAGIDVGVREFMTVAAVRNDVTPPMGVTRVHGLPVAEALERVHHRIRRLRSLADTGGKNAARALKRTRHKRANIQRTFVWQSAKTIVDRALLAGANGIAVEDLRRMKPRGLSRRQNRRISIWARGASREALAQKATENGLAFKEVTASGTSSICPSCGTLDRSSRDRSKHLYICKTCGHVQNDDEVGAINIARRGWRYWHSPKWDSQSTPRQQESRGMMPAETPVGDARAPHEEAEVGGPAASNGAADENRENRTTGTAEAPQGANAATSPGTGRSQLRQPQKRKRRPSTSVAVGRPETARTDGKGRPTDHGDAPGPSTTDPPLERGVGPPS